ncbi:phosphopantetheine-binding protein [Streptomyces sp. NPDC020607]|uniref:phosphopantetheine-binding protein n=1 Tax=Streptomyces sp. NPDC020607 TaxID=3365082 RepID=UPI00379AAF1A
MTVDSGFRNPMDALVVNSVRNLTGRTSVGIGDDFFDIGGNSIIAIRLGHVLSEELGIPRTVRVIFKNPVLSDLSDALSELAGGTATA